MMRIKERTLGDLIAEIPVPLVEMIKREARTALLDQVLTIVDAAMTHVCWRDDEPLLTIHRQRLRDEITALRPPPARSTTDDDTTAP